MKNIKICLVLLMFVIGMIAVSPISAGDVNFTSDSGFKLNVPKDKDYTVQKIVNVNFSIPLDLINNSEISNSSNYVLILSDSDIEISSSTAGMLKFDYGADLYDCDYVMRKTVDGHPACFLLSSTHTAVYFRSSGYDIYFIDYGDNYNSKVEKDIDKIIKSTPKATLSADDFYRRLEFGQKGYFEDLGERLNRNGEDWDHTNEKIVSNKTKFNYTSNHSPKINSDTDFDEDYDYDDGYWDGWYNLAPASDDEDYMDGFYDGYYDNYDYYY